MRNTNEVRIKGKSRPHYLRMITRAFIILAIASATTISQLPTFTSSAYAIKVIHHRDPSFSPFLPIPFSPPCIPTSMLLDSVSVLSMEYQCSIPNTLHPNVALSSQHNLMASRQISPNSSQQLPPQKLNNQNILRGNSSHVLRN